MITPEQAARARALDLAIRTDEALATYTKRFEEAVQKYPKLNSYQIDDEASGFSCLVDDSDRVITEVCRLLERDLRKAGWIGAVVKFSTWFRTVKVEVTP